MAFPVPEGLQDATEEQLSAMLEVMYYVAKSDGIFSHEELTHFLSVSSEISGGRISSARLAIIVRNWEEKGEIDLEARVDEIKELLPTPHLRELACNLAAQLAEADDAVLSPEQKILDMIGRKFFS